MSRDRFVHTESGTRPVNDPHGRDDNGFPLTRTEKEVYDRLKDEGYTVRKHGWPDFIAEKIGGPFDDVRLIEVKAPKDAYRMSQLHNHRSLKRLGIHVERIRTR